MKKINIIIILMMLLTMASASAYFYGYDFHEIRSWSNPSACQGHNFSSCDHIQYYKIWDFDILTHTEETLIAVLDTLTPDMLAEFNFKIVLGWTIDPRVTQYDVNVSIKNFSINCKVRDPFNGSTMSDRDIIIDTFTPQNVTMSDYDNYEFITLEAGEQLYCVIDTYYYNHSLFYELGAITPKLYVPSVASPYNIALEKTVMKKDVIIEDLQGQVQEKYENEADYVIASLKALVQMNIDILIILFWIFRIGVVLFAVGLIFYLVFWIYRWAKKHWG